MTLPCNQRGFKVENNMVVFSHKVNDVNLSFDISNLVNCLKIKQA
jgi:putative transposase